MINALHCLVRTSAKGVNTISPWECFTKDMVILHSGQIHYCEKIYLEKIQSSAVDLINRRCIEVKYYREILMY